MWFDTHCHLYDLDDGAAAADRALDAGVSDVLVVGVDPPTNQAAIELAERAGIWAGVAFHPSAVKGWQPGWADEVEALLDNDRVIAVGETGTDLYWDNSYWDDQVAAFETHVGLAKRYDKALVIHTRDSLDETFEILDRVGPPERLVFHCWSGDETQLARAAGMDAYISFAGNVTFKSAGNIRSAARSTPADRLLVETDSPYLTPVPHRGERNEPAYVVHVGEAVAEAREVEAADLAALTSGNARRVFGLEA